MVRKYELVDAKKAFTFSERKPTFVANEIPPGRKCDRTYGFW
jgi:hypothetical protein